ncbi:MAG: tetratricopeptide repeat protein [Bacteroidia bacterium]
MKIFGLNIGSDSAKKQEPVITSIDKNWVEDMFIWLLKAFGYPSKENGPFLFSDKYFPVTFKSKKLTIENLISDICSLLVLDRTKISFELVPDIRDISQTPYEIQGRAFESELEIINDDQKKPHYILHISNSLQSSEKLFLRRLILELVKVKIFERKPKLYAKFDASNLVYLAAIYFGFGLIISDGLIDIGVQYVAGWQKTWKNKSEVPPQVIIYAIAAYAKLRGEENPEWKANLPIEQRIGFDSAMESFTNNTEIVLFNTDFIRNMLIAEGHINHGAELSKKNEFEKAIAEYEKAISLLTDIPTILLLYINIGYAYLRLKQYEKSLPSFNKAMELRPDYSYSLNNMGFAYIMMNQLDKGKEYLDKASNYNDNLKVYSLRDYAIYYMKKGDLVLAETYFNRAFDMHLPVDLLEYFYSELLMMKSEKDEAMKYLSKSVEKGEPEGIELMNTLQNSN